MQLEAIKCLIGAEAEQGTTFKKQSKIYIESLALAKYCENCLKFYQKYNGLRFSIIFLYYFIFFIMEYTVRIKKKVIELCSALVRSLYNVQKYSFAGGKTRLLAFNCHHFCEI